MNVHVNGDLRPLDAGTTGLVVTRRRIEQVQADDAIAYPLVAVIGDDLGEELVGAGQEQSSAQGAAELPHEGAGAQALAADPAEALR